MSRSGKYKGLITRTKTDAALAAEADARAKKRQEEVLKRAAMRKQREKMDREGVGPDAVDPEEVGTWVGAEGAVRVTHPYLPSGAGPLPALSSFAPRELCPGGAATILAELGTVSREDGVVPAEVAEIEFQRLFGPLRLRDQAFQSLRFECAADAHRAVADVCLGEKCDEWSKYALPRCQVFLGLPYDFGDSNFLYAPACERSGQFYCPPGLPLALQLTLKAGSRSATVWAAMLEGLMPGIVAVRRTLAVQLGLSEESNKLARYAWEWLEHEETRLGCGGDLAFFSISRGVGMLDQGQIGLPMALCPSCCRRASGRLRVIFLRDPVARMWSFFEGYWFPRKGQLLPEPSFETWLRLILSRNASSSSLFEASDLDHVREAAKDFELVDGRPAWRYEEVLPSLEEGRCPAAEGPEMKIHEREIGWKRHCNGMDPDFPKNCNGMKQLLPSSLTLPLNNFLALDTGLRAVDRCDTRDTHATCHRCQDARAAFPPGRKWAGR
eukprot:g4182.t3